MVTGADRRPCALLVTGIVLLLTWLIFHSWLPWWLNALALAGATIASIEAVAQARKASRNE